MPSSLNKDFIIIIIIYINAMNNKTLMCHVYMLVHVSQKYD